MHVNFKKSAANDVNFSQYEDVTWTKVSAEEERRAIYVAESDTFAALIHISSGLADKVLQLAILSQEESGFPVLLHTWSHLIKVQTEQEV